MNLSFNIQFVFYFRSAGSYLKIYWRTLNSNIMSNLKRYKNLSKIKDKTNVFKETDIKVENHLSFSGNARITRSSLTKLQSLPPEPNKKEIAATSSYKDTNLIADVNNIKSDQMLLKLDQNSYISKKPGMNTEVKPMYSIV